MPLHSPWIIKDARLKIVDAPLMLISIMGLGAYRLSFYLLRWPILPHWVDTTMQPFDCWMGTTVNHWCSVDAHLGAHLRGTLTVIECSTIVHKMHIIFIGSQYTVSTYYYLHLKALRPLSFIPTTIHIIWMMNDVSASRFCTFSWQFTA